MSRRPFVALSATAAALAAGLAFIPGSAQAAGSSPGVVRAPATGTGVPTSIRTFTSPAPKAAPLRHVATVTPRATGTVIYASTDIPCTTETGNGTQATPYCILQDAVNAAVAGDTIEVVGSGVANGVQTVTITKSNISIIGMTNEVGLIPWSGDAGKPAITLDGVTGVTISNLILTTSGAPALEVIGSSDVTIDSSYLDQYPSSTAGISTLTIDGTSSHVTVSRTYLDTGGWSAGTYGVSVASGASDVTLASDLIAATGVQATGVSGLNVVGDTIERGCASAVDVEGTSTGVSIEDNLLEDANPSTDASLGGYQSQCTTKGQTWAPDVTVATGSAAATTADYNDFASYGTDDTARYGGVSAGAHDTTDTTSAFPVGDLRPGYPTTIDAAIVTTSPAVNSANTSVPGRTTSDFFGTSPYSSRGALQYLTRNPTLAASLKAQDTTARGITLAATITSADLQLTETADWGDGTSTSTSQASVDSWNIPPHEYAKLGMYTITVTLDDGQGDAFRSVLTIETLGTEYTAYGPTRVLDTRKGIGTNGATTPVPAGGMVRLLIGGNGGIPADVWAVALNLTVTDATANGYITAYPDGLKMPTTSNVNFNAGQTVANMAVVAIGDGGYIDLHNTGAGTVDLVADASGYFTPTNTGDGYTSLGPVRFLDTRDGTGGYPYTTVSSAHPVKLKVAGVNGVPSGVAAVAVNLTVAVPSSSGYITAYPDGGTQPGVSNVNFQAGQVLANAAIVPVGADGSIDLAFTGLGSTRLIADVYGYYSANGASQYVVYAPYRYFDSRQVANGALKSGFYYYLPLAQDSSRTVLPYITSLITNTTVTDTTSNGYLVVFPDNSDGGVTPVTIPNTSTLNFLPNQTIPNLTFATPGPDGSVDYYNSSGGSLQLVVDVYGIFMNS